jgi:hypothetical protein
MEATSCNIVANINTKLKFHIYLYYYLFIRLKYNNVLMPKIKTCNI